MGVHGKIQLWGGVHEKPNIKGGLPKKGGLGQFVDLRGARQERGVVFLRVGGWYPNAHYAPPTLFFLLSCFLGWMGDRATIDVLFYLMIIWIYTCQAFVLCTRRTLICVSWTRRQVYWSLTHNLVFYWCSDLISITHNTHNTHPL